MSENGVDRERKVRGLFRRRGSPYWWIQFTTPTGRVRESTKTTSKKLAQLILSDRRSQVARGMFLGKRGADSVTFGRLAEDYLKNARVTGRSPERAMYAIKPLMLFFGANTLASQIKRADVNDYRDARLSEVKAGTVFRELTVLRALFNRAVERGLLIANPASRVRMPRLRGRQRLLSEEELEALLQACKSSKAGYLFNAVKLCLLTGLRKSELLALRWSDIDLKERRLVVEHGKGNKRRVIPLCAEAAELLRSLSRDSEFVINDRGRQIKSIRRSFNYAVKQAGLSDVVFHDLRHQFASMLSASGADPFSIRLLLGHSDLKTSMIYIHVDDMRLRNAVEGLPKLRPDDSASREVKATITPH